MTDHNEALRLAVLMDAMDYGDTRKAAALLRQQAEQIAELEKEALAKPFAPDWAGYRQGLEDGKREGQAERDQLRAEVAANRELDALRIAATHIHSELRSIVQAGGSDEAIGREFRKRILPEIEDEVTRLRAEVERLRVDAERIDYLEYEVNELRTRETGEDDYEWVVRSNHMDQPYERDVGRGKTIRAAIDNARTTHKDEG